MGDIVKELQQSEAVVWWHWHRRLYNWVIHFADTRYAEVALFALSFSESSFFPVPPDVLLAVMALGVPRRWLRFALLCSVASVVGGIFGYCIGMFLWHLIGNWVFAHFGWLGFTPENFEKIRSLYNKYDYWVVSFAGFTPFPYKVCTVSAGVFRIRFVGFVIASVLSRSARFFMVAGLIGWKGPKVKPVIEKYFNWFTFAFAAMLIGGFIVIKWLY
jgi:membrane protein YqaA with SNARE-associated domain